MKQRVDPELDQEWLRQNNLAYGALIGVAVVMVKPFLTAATLDTSATISVVAFSVAVPLLAALILINRQESFRRRRARSPLVSGTQVVAQLAAFTGLIAGFLAHQPRRRGRARGKHPARPGGPFDRLCTPGGQRRFPSDQNAGRRLPAR